MTKRAGIYGRVATVGQAKHDYGLPSQLEASRRYAEERGWKTVEEVADQGVSGTTLDRPGLNSIRDMAGAGQIDIVVIHRTDRLSRKVAHLLSLEEEFSKAGVEVHCVLGNYEDGDVARLVKTIRSACAEYEIAILSERAKRSKRQKPRDGSSNRRLLSVNPHRVGS